MNMTPEQIKNWRKVADEMERELEGAIKMLDYVQCIQNCNGGAVMEEDGPIQCQWCHEIEQKKAALTAYREAFFRMCPPCRPVRKNLKKKK